MAKLIGNPWHCDRSIYWLTLWMQANQMQFNIYSLSLQMAKLIGNPWHCDRSIYWLTLWMQANQVQFFSPDHMTCASPPKLKGKRIVDLDPTILPRVKRPGKVKPNVEPIDIPFHYGKGNFTVAVNFSTDEQGNIDDAESELLFNDTEEEIGESGEVTETETVKLVPDETSTQGQTESQTSLSDRFGSSSKGLFEVPTKRKKHGRVHSTSSEITTKSILKTTTNTPHTSLTHTKGGRGKSRVWDTNVIPTIKSTAYSETSTKSALERVVAPQTMTVPNAGHQTTSKPVFLIDQPEDLGLQTATSWSSKETSTTPTDYSTKAGHSFPSVVLQGITSTIPTAVPSQSMSRTTQAPVKYTPPSHSNSPTVSTVRVIPHSPFAPSSTHNPHNSIDTHAMPYHNNAIIKNTVNDKYRKHKNEQTFYPHQWKKPHKTLREQNTDPNVGHIYWRNRHRYSEGSGTHHRPTVQHIIQGQGVERVDRTQSHSSMRRNIFSKLFPNQTIPHMYKHGDGSGNLDQTDKDQYIPLKHVRKGLFYNAYIRPHTEYLNNSGEDRT